MTIETDWLNGDVSSRFMCNLRDHLLIGVVTGYSMLIEIRLPLTLLFQPCDLLLIDRNHAEILDK